ncbi:hypothetical protein [Gimesia fumaroli]|uniref:Uncharacterized protein n=1 Tax=Gimesia fumaroli TaxID=2527976 RepID=A0A518IKW2_9PLAN|nr:hypothetical protein [Gimesia fumaroli]QDV53705.1 hypothetical protein Enr17x_57860 [Gimesia fumaroli]
MPDVSEILTKPVQRFRSRVTHGPVNSIDPEGGENGAGIIKGFSVITRGVALGHQMWCDSVFIEQCKQALNAAEKGLKSRWTHPGLSADGMGKQLGDVKGGESNGNQLFADLHFYKIAHKAPDGDLATYVMEFAKDHPDKFGSSIVFMGDQQAQEQFMLEHTNSETGSFESPDEDNVNNYMHCRLKELYAVDIVDDPAANPGGMFSRGQEIPNNAEALLNYALHVEGAEKPSTFDFGIDPDRFSAFLDRYLDNHNLKIISNEELKQMPTGKEESEKSELNVDEIRSQIITEYNANMNRYIQKFGAENGAKWLAEGKSYSEACELHIDELNKQLAAKDEAYAELQKKFDSIDLGEDTPLESGEAKGGKGKKELKDLFRVPALN